MSLQHSPFKFLDAYQQEDHDIFFGREAETEALYEALSGVKQLLVYGPSGAGKTSLIECGLRNQFSDADWFALTVRRGSNAVASFYTSINEVLDNPIPLDEATYLPKEEEKSFGHAVEDVFSERYQPIYLLFDQFEELLLLGEEEEKRDFFTRLDKLIRYKVPCRVLLIMREEFIGHLSEYEPLCPSLFQHRFRLEKMGRSGVREIIERTLAAPQFEDAFTVEDAGTLATAVLDRLPDRQREIELTHVQVFLSELWDRARAANTEKQRPHLTRHLVQSDDNLEAVLDSFLKKQLHDLEPAYGPKAPLETLAAMISERYTKLQLSEEEIRKDLLDKEVELPLLHPLLNDLEEGRLIRSLKAGGRPRYEISHDVLAKVVGQNLTEEMQLREKAREIYRVYGERAGLLGQEDLDYLRPFQQYLALPPALKKRMEDSEQALAQEKEAELAATRRRLRVVGSLLVLAVIALVGAGYFWNDARLKEQRANELLQENIRKDSQNRAEIFKRYMTEAEGLEQQRNYEDAITRYEIAADFAQDSATVKKAIADCRAARERERKFEELLAAAAEAEEKENYGQAVDQYAQANELVGLRPELRERVISFRNSVREEARKAEENANAVNYDVSPNLELLNKYRQQARQLNNWANRLNGLLRK